MNNYFHYWLGLMIFPVLIFSWVHAQNPYFEGTIKYNIEYDGKAADVLMLNKPCIRMDMHFKDNNFIIHTYEGQLPKTRLYIADSSEMYILDLGNQVAYRRDRLEDTSKVITPPRAHLTGDTAIIAGLKCLVYKVSKAKEITLYYVHDSIRVNTNLFKGKKDAQMNFLTEGLEGRIPLKTVRKTPDITITTTAVQILPRKFKMDQFRIPAGTQIKPRDNRM
jgi:hypothetical protein